MIDFVRQLYRKTLQSEDEDIRKISMLDALFGFVAGILVGTQVFIAMLR